MEDFPAIAMLVFGGVCLVSHIKTVSALQGLKIHVRYLNLLWGYLPESQQFPWTLMVGRWHFLWKMVPLQLKFVHFQEGQVEFSMTSPSTFMAVRISWLSTSWARKSFQVVTWRGQTEKPFPWMSEDFGKWQVTGLQPIYLKTHLLSFY